MIKLLFAILLSVFVITGLNADPVDSVLAKTVAVNFYNRSAMNKMKGGIDFNLKHTETFKVKDNTKGEEETPLYYVFTAASGNAFIMVAADNDVKPILGYSDNSMYAETNQPPAFTEFMNNYKKQIVYVKQNSLKADTVIEKQWTQLEAGADLSKGTNSSFQLLTTQWNQGNTSRGGYYNNLCPTDLTLPNDTNISLHCPTGCVATAMAQIMKYWNYPIMGTGSNSYATKEYGTLKANFSNTAYDWSDMPDILNNSYSTKQINAVATLMYHCGISINTDYGPDGSSGMVFSSDSPYSAENAYKSYFGYGSSMNGITKSTGYTDASWESTIKNELDNGRPVEYVDYEASGDGHSWVCDGYNDFDYFHMNWGWGGSCNGFYELSSLNTSYADFSSTQEAALIGIQPNCADLLHTGIWTVSGDKRSTIDTVFSTIDAIVTCPYTVAKMSSPGANDTHVTLNGKLIYGGDMAGLTNVIITYQSDQPITISLPQRILKDAGESYQASLAATGYNVVSVNIPIDSFIQPAWSTHKNIPLQMDSVYSIDITPNVNASASAVNGTIVINELLLYDVKNNTFNDTKATNDNIVVYPNPTSGYIMFKTLASVSLTNLKIYNMLGKIVYSNNINNFSDIDISGFPKGLYMVKLQTDNGTVVKKIMIE